MASLFDRLKRLVSTEAPAPRQAAQYGVGASTRANDGFPFPDFRQSAPGQTLRADLNLRNPGIFPRRANVQMHMQGPAGRLLTIPQSSENLSQDDYAHYGTEVQVPQDAEPGAWNVWASVNNREVPGSRQSHNVVQAPPIDRYSAERNTNPYNPTLSYDRSKGPQSGIRSLLNRMLGGF